MGHSGDPGAALTSPIARPPRWGGTPAAPSCRLERPQQTRPQPGGGASPRAGCHHCSQWLRGEALMRGPGGCTQQSQPFPSAKGQTGGTHSCPPAHPMQTPWVCPDWGPTTLEKTWEPFPLSFGQRGSFPLTQGQVAGKWETRQVPPAPPRRWPTGARRTGSTFQEQGCPRCGTGPSGPRHRIQAP